MFGELHGIRTFYNHVKEIKLKLIMYELLKKVVEIIWHHIRISIELVFLKLYPNSHMYAIILLSLILLNLLS